MIRQARGESPSSTRGGGASALASGMLVQHATLGVGRVVAVEPAAVHVFFPRHDRRHAAKFHLPTATSLLSSAGVAPDAWLEGLTSFALDPVSRRYALAADWITHEEAIARFHATYPRGFLDPAYVGDGTGKRERASRWRAAAAEWGASLGGGQLARLLADGKAEEAARRALRVEKLVVLATGTLAPGALARAFRDGAAAAAFFEALAALVEAPSATRSRLDPLFAAAAALDLEPGQAWPVATVFPFLADPSRHVFVSPKATCAAAELLGCDLRYAPEPNWATWQALRALSATLLAKLEPSGARDFVDVEGFLHEIAIRRAPSARRKTDAAAPPRKPVRRATKA